MILQVVFAVIAGKLKGYRVGHALTRKSFIPFYVIELVHIFSSLTRFLATMLCPVCADTEIGKPYSR